jgi:hypothetical protein
MTDTVSTGTRYVEIARTGATSATISFSSTSAYTKDIDSKTYTIENVTGLKYFKIFNNSSGSTSGQVNGTIDDMKFYNGITSVGVGAGDAKPTNVQAGSRFEETDTRKMYHKDDVDWKEENGNEATNYRSASWYEQLSGETP